MLFGGLMFQAPVQLRITKERGHHEQTHRHQRSGFEL
jgi:hypothetical protein